MTPPASLYLLDTNIVIHYGRGLAVGQQIEKDYSLLTTPYRPLICVVTRGEMYAFGKKRGWGPARISAVNKILAQFVSVDINDPQVIEAYAEIDCHSQLLGRKMGKNDLWIAAATSVAAATLITTDGDFDHLDRTHLTLIKIDPTTGQTI